MMQTSNVLYCYLKLSNNYAPIFQLVPPAFQALGTQSPELQKSFSTQYESSVGICIHNVSM